MIAQGVETFQGVRRRQEVRGIAGGVTVIDDFAHHPTAIRQTLLGLRGVYGEGKLIAVFEPRSATSRRNVFQDEFVHALAAADEVVIAGVFEAEKIPPHQRLAPDLIAQTLRDRGTSAVYLEEFDAVLQHLLDICQPSDTVVIMSSGGFGGLHQKLLTALGEK
jgi:UDP-N-acetylmuramate: L-alanyl-gamma-D-glutamyl-meso-diaminopimelate ligase